MNHLMERDLPTWKINDPTKITTFMECPRKYFYSYVLGWRREAPSNHLVFGSAWHVAMEYLLTHNYSPLSVVEGHRAFLGEYRKVFGPETDEMFWPKTPNNALIALNAYAKRFESDLTLWNPLYTEIAGKISLNNNLNIHFRMDSIVEHKTKGIIKSIEHKTGSNTYNWELQWPLSMQNGAYTHVLYCLFPPDMVEGVAFRGSFFYKRKGAWEKLNKGQPLGTLQPPYDFMEFPAKKSLEQMQSWLWVTSWWVENILREFEYLAEVEEADPVLMAFPMNPTSCTRWFGCEFLDFCTAWQNPLQRCHQPPLGFVENHWDPSSKPAKKTFDIEAVE